VRTSVFEAVTLIKPPASPEVSNFIDTANICTNGTSETMLGEFVGAERDRFVIATKYTAVTNPNDPNSSGKQRKNLMRSLEASLKRLNTDYIDPLLRSRLYSLTLPYYLSLTIF